ncbi:Dimethylmenaquinone methyltransferase (fragment) [Burkholderiales bacterium]
MAPPAAFGPLDTRGRAEMVEQDTRIDIAGVRVAPGDWVMGDIDGVVFVPADRADAVFRAALDKIAAEDTTRAELAAGESLHAVYARHGVL